MSTQAGAESLDRTVQRGGSVVPPAGANLSFLVPAALLCVVFLIPTRLTFMPLGNAGRPAVIVGVALLVLWALTLAVRHGLPAGGQPLRWVVLAYLVIEANGYATGYGRGLVELESNSADRAMIVRLAMAGIILVIADGPRTRAHLDRLLQLLIGLGVVVGLVGMIQFFLGVDLQRHIHIPGLRPLIDLVEIRNRGSGEGVSRVAGLSTHYIEYGVVLGMLSPLAVHLALFTPTPGQRLIRWGAVVVILAAVPMSVSRSGIVALAVGMSVLAAVWSWRLRYNALIIAMVALVMFRAVAPGVLGTLRALFTNLEHDPSVEGRTKDYAIVFPMIFDRPVWGRGVGTFLPERYIVLDNQVLYTLVSSGVVGLIAFFGLYVSGMMIARSIRRRARAAEDRHLAQALCAAIAAGLLASFTFDALGFVQFRSVLCVMLGLVGALWRLSRTRPSDPVMAHGDPRGRITRPRWPDFGWVGRSGTTPPTGLGRR